MFNKREKLILTLLILTHFCLIVDFMILMPLGSLFMRIFDISASKFGLLVAAFTLLAGLSGIGGALFIDRFDRKRLLIVTLVGFLLSNLLCGLSANFNVLIFSRAVTGFFAGLCGTLLITIVSDTISLDKRGTALGLLMSAFALASIVGVPSALYLTSKLGWQTPFFILSVLSLALIGAIQKWMPVLRDHLTANNSNAQKGTLNMFKFITDHQPYLMGIIFMALLMFGHFTINPFLFTTIVVNGGYPEANLPFVYLAAGVASLASAIGFGRLTDLLGQKKTFYWTLLGSLFPIVLVTHLFSSTPWVVMLSVSLFFVLMGGRMTPAMTLITSIAKPEDRGRYLSYIVSVQHLATAGASVLAGSIIVKSHDGTLLNFSTIGYIAAFFSVLALVMSKKLKPIDL